MLMKRGLTIALGLLLTVLPMAAQMRVVRPMGGSGVAGSRIASGPRVGFGTHGGFRGPVFVGGIHRNRFVVRPGFQHRFYPRVRAYPYAYLGYGSYAYASDYYAADPYYVNAGSSYYDTAAEQQAGAGYQQMNEQLAELTTEVRDLRDENEALRTEVQTQKKPAAHAKEQKEVTPAAPAAEKITEQEQATVLVYKDGHKREVRSFAIVGKTLWILSEQRAQKILLSELDLDATDKANAERGIDFPMPATK